MLLGTAMSSGLMPRPAINVGSSSAADCKALNSRAAWDSGAEISEMAWASTPRIPPATLASNTTRFEIGKSPDLIRPQELALDHAALDHQLRIGTGEVPQALRHHDGISVDESDGRWTDELLL